MTVPFISFEKELIRAKYVENQTTKCKLCLNGNIKVLYKYMYDRFVFFRGNNNKYYENQEDIAEGVAMSKRFVMESQKGLIKVGLLTKKSLNLSNSYVVNNIFNSNFKLYSSTTTPPKDKSEVLDFDDEEF